MQIGDVLMLGGDKPELGSPMVSGASVAAEIIEQSRGAKVIAFKKRRRKNSRRKRGHRQDYTAGPDLRDPDRRRQADQGPEAEARAQAQGAEAAADGEEDDGRRPRRQASKKAGAPRQSPLPRRKQSARK